MIEIEAKFKVENSEELKRKLDSIGAEFESQKKQRDTYFEHPKKTELKDTPTYLRIRTSDGKSWTAMHIKIDSYNWEEIETPVEDGDKVREIYSNLGFPVYADVIKERKTYKVQGGEIVIDKIERLGEFIEIEVESNDLLKGYCEKLGFDLENNKVKDKPYPELLRELKGKL